jgi:translation initiation factor IF-3
LRKVRWSPISIQAKLRINGGIRVPSVRLIDDANAQVGIVPTDDALARAREAGLDLVEVSPTSDPPVCRIMDYGKWLYQQKRKVREAHKKHTQHATTLKEIRLRPEIDKHDLDIKLKHGHEFIEKGHKVQFTVLFRGRQILHQDLGRAVLDQITTSLEPVAKVERPSMMTGRRMVMILVPK